MQASHFIKQGRLIQQDDSDIVVSRYLANSEGKLTTDNIRSLLNSYPPDAAFRLNDVRILQNGRETNLVGNGQPIEIQVVYDVLDETLGLRVFFDLYDKNEIMLFRSFHDAGFEIIEPMQKGHYCSITQIPANWLAPMTYTLQFHAGIHNTRMVMPSDIKINLDVHNTGIVNKAYAGDPIRGSLAPLLLWTTQRLD